MALMMIMVVSLLVYTLAQRRLRQALALAHQTIPNQKGQPTAIPTLRWVFQSFLFIRWLEIDGIQTIVNRTAIPNSNGINRDRKTLTYRKL
jgi:transposase